MVGTILVLASNILSTPQPFDQLLIRMPTAPAFSSATGKVLLVFPVLRIRSAHAFVRALLSAVSLSNVSFNANSFRLSSGLPVGWHMDIITNFPLTLGNHALKAVESARSGSITICAVAVF